jgi:hypothetical protein
MWQIQWALSLIPDSVLIYIYHTFILIGLLCYIGSKLASKFPFKYIPILGQYRFISEIVGVILLTLGAWCIGGYDVEMAWRDKVKQVEAKIETAKEESKEANIQIQTKIVKQKEIVHDVQIQVQKEIQVVEKQIDAECKLDPVVPTIHNKAAKNPFNPVYLDPRDAGGKR